MTFSDRPVTAVEGERAAVKSAEVVYLPFDKTSSMTVSGTGTSPMVRLAHATSRVGSPASMTPAVIIVFVCSRLVSDM